MYYLLVGAPSRRLYPDFYRIFGQGDEEEGWKVASTFINITALLLIIFTVFRMIFAGGGLVGSQFSEDKMLWLVKTYRELCFRRFVFTALADTIGEF